MVKKQSLPIIFFLTLEERLPPSYYQLNEVFKDHGMVLVPVKADQVQSLAFSTEQSNIIILCSVSNLQEFKSYTKIRPLMKFILRSKRISFINLSSFSTLNDSKNFVLQKNYFFVKYPVDARVLAAKVTRYHELKTEQSSKWPGGKRAGLSPMVT